MNADILVENLERTIAGKEFYMQSIGTAPSAARSFVLLNIDELKKILADAKQVQQRMLKLELYLETTHQLITSELVRL